MNGLDEILDLLKNVGMIIAGAFYLAIVVWTYKDSRKRTDDPILVATFTALSMVPVFGVLLYMLVRPSEYLADVRERELEIRMMERQLGRQERCPYCKSHIEGDYLSCPVCTTKLRQTCVDCHKPLDPRWMMCPYCEAEVPGRDRPSAGGSGSDSRRSGRTSTPSRDSKPAKAPKADREESKRSRAPRTPSSPRDRAKGGSGAGADRSTSKSSPKSSSESSSKGSPNITTEPF